MNKYFTKTILLILGFSLLVLPVLSISEASSLKVNLPKTSKAYSPGDSIEISWTPASTPVQIITFIPVKKGETKGYTVYSDKVSGDPIITSGKYTYTFENHSIAAGSYYVGIGLPGTEGIVAKSSKKINVENRPSLYFGTATGEVNSVSINPGDSVKLKWDAKSVKKCEASSFPINPKWKNSVSSSGSKKIKVYTPTTFYLTCTNNLGEVSTTLKVETEAPDRSPARLVPSTTFVNYNFPLGTTQDKAMTYNASITLFNSSNVDPIYYRIVADDKPDWINTGYTTSQLTLPPNGTAGIGAFADPSRVSKSGTYEWDLKLEGNFSNSPLLIPITMTVTR